MAYAACAACAALVHIKKRGYPLHLAPRAAQYCHSAPTFSQRVFAENPKRSHHMSKRLENFRPGSCSRERPNTVCDRSLGVFSARRISHFEPCVLHVVWAISAEMAHVTFAAKRLDLTSAPVLICTGINCFSGIPALNGELEKQTLPDSQTCVVCPWLYLKIHPTHPHWSLNTKTAGTRLS
eukprot:s5239_g2.t1